jgi:CRISPR-associated endonuclease Csn1
MENILGIDLGTNSIGWAIRDTSENENQIVDKGVLTFDKGVAEDKSGEHPMVQKRTESRGKRRNYQAEKYRKYELLECLIENDMCPLTIEELNEWRHYKKGIGRKYPKSEKFIEWLRFDFDGDSKPDFYLLGLDKHESYYAFRAFIIDQNKKEVFQKNKHIIGRVLYQIVQRRGYNNIYNLTEKDNEELSGTIMKGGGEAGAEGVNTIKPFIEKYKTLGSALYHIQKEEKVRIRKRYNLRTDFENEINEICKVQGLDSIKEQIKKAIIWQRPLRTQKGNVGFCSLDKPQKSETGAYLKSGKKRIPLSHPLYEEFRTWVDINNLKIEAPEGIVQLDFLENKILSLFNKASDFYYSDKKDKKEKITKGLKSKIIELGATINSKFDENIEEDQEGKKYIANTFINKIETIFGEDWKLILKWNETLNNKPKTGKYLRTEDIWHLIYDASVTKNQQDNLGKYIIPILEKHFPAIVFNAKDFEKFKLSKGYASLSTSTILTILPYLKQGLLYSHAVFIANLGKVFGKELNNSELEKIKNDYLSLISNYRIDKEVNIIVNSLIADTYNNNDSLSRDKKQPLTLIDLNDIDKKIKEIYTSKQWNKKSDEQKKYINEEVKNKYHNFLTQDIGFDKGKQFYKIYRIEEKLIELLINKYQVDENRINKYLWHPSEQEIYNPAYIKADKNGEIITTDEGKEIYFLGDPNPISRGFKNPMALKTLQYLKKLINYLLETQKINSNTRIVIEIARELNDSNTRKAIAKYQSDRKKVRDGLKKDIQTHYDHHNISNTEITENMINRFELWEEQSKKCLYCSKEISCTDVLNGSAQIEHTIPAGISNCSEMYNLTLAHASCNEKKSKRYPTQWTDNYELIKNNVKFMYAKFKSYEEKVEEAYKKTRTATTKDSKDYKIQDRHLYKMYMMYWKKKYETFTIEEVTNQFRRQQLTDTQVITKYALPYMRTVFKKVEVQKGIDTDKFRKIYQIRERFETKDRTKHSHHAIDAAVLTLIPSSSIRDFLRKQYNEAIDNNTLNSYIHPKPKYWDNFKPKYIINIEDEVLINYLPEHRTLTHTKKQVRKRGKLQFVKNKLENGKWEYKLDKEGNKIPMVADGDSIRGQLHKDSYFGAINKENNIILVERYPIATFTSITDCKNIVDDKVRELVHNELQRRMNNGLSFDKAKLEPIPFHKGNEVIKKVRCKVLAGAGYLGTDKAIKINEHSFKSKHEYKHHVYAQNDQNTYCLYYEKETENKIVRAFKIVGLFELAQLGLKNENDISNETFYKTTTTGKGKNEVELSLVNIIKVGTKCIFYNKTIEELKDLKNIELLQRLFRVYKFNLMGTPNLFLQNHLEARKNEQLNDGETTFNSTQKSYRLKIKADKFTCAIENIHFKINVDGTIHWL